MNGTKETFKTGSNVMILAFKCQWIMESLPVSSMTKTPSDNDHAEKGPSSKEVFHCLEIAMKWLAQQEECDDVQLPSLKCVRDLAAINK
ncbi:hypothetical protein AVEN_26752-1 [Araneus ventricosus]|uniref:Uncharacterized protein n=1 Tax=Araneus ventricosus TaxID=182803 RepID=A0A4Y2D502_ARAVE|nr:hypothetical protein AVEN_26752-1 [Araneus ventricosus]